MNILKNYYKYILKYDFVNKFNYKNINQIPEIKKIVLNFNCKNCDIKKIATAILALELITAENGIITKSRKAAINLKIRKGHPVGCKIILEKEKMDFFLFKLLNKILSELKNFKGFPTKIHYKNNFSFSLNDLINFDELNSNFYLFSTLPTLNITIVYNTKNSEELFFFLNSLKIPLI